MGELAKSSYFSRALNCAEPKLIWKRQLPTLSFHGIVLIRFGPREGFSRMGAVQFWKPSNAKWPAKATGNGKGALNESRPNP